MRGGIAQAARHTMPPRQPPCHAAAAAAPNLNPTQWRFCRRLLLAQLALFAVWLVAHFAFALAYVRVRHTLQEFFLQQHRGLQRTAAQ